MGNFRMAFSIYGCGFLGLVGNIGGENRKVGRQRVITGEESGNSKATSLMVNQAFHFTGYRALYDVLYSTYVYTVRRKHLFRAVMAFTVSSLHIG